MRTLRYLFFLSFLPVFFLSGWVLRGVVDQERNEIAPDLSPALVNQNSDDDVSRAIGATSKLPHRERARNANTASVESEVQFAEDIVAHFQKREFQAAYRLLLTVRFGASVVFSEADIEAIAGSFFVQIVDMGIDPYIDSELLLSIGEEVVLLDNYSPYAQLFGAIAKTDKEPEIALYDFDALDSYYQEQVSARQLGLVENWILHRAEKNFLAKQDWKGLDEWYLVLIARANDPSDLYRRQAALHFRQGRYLESLEGLDLVSQYSSWTPDDERLYEKNRERIGKESVASIQLERLGGNFVAALELNGHIPVRLLMDTGASLSALDYRFAQSYNLRTNGRKIRMSTANGPVESELLDIRSAKLGGHVVPDLAFATLDFGDTGSRGFHGLLGMDILSQFQFYLDQREAVLYLNVGGDIGSNLFGR